MRSFKLARLVRDFDLTCTPAFPTLIHGETKKIHFHPIDFLDCLFEVKVESDVNS